MILGRAVAIIKTALRDDTDFTTCDISFQVCLDTFATTAGSLGIQFSAIHVEDTVTANTCCCLCVSTVGKGLVYFPCTITSSNHCCTPAIDGDVCISIDRFTTVCRNLYIDDAAIDEHVVTCFDTVIFSGFDIEVDTFVDDDVALAVDSILIRSVNVQRTVTADQELSLAEESAFMVFRSSVSQLVGTTDNKVGIAFAFQVKGSGSGTGDTGIVEVQLEICLAVNGQ